MIKWIGQHIFDFVARFRSTVYLEDLDTSTETNIVVVDSDGKVTKNTDVKTNLLLNLVENKSSSTIRGEIVSGDIPTLNQNTTGTAAGLSATLAVSSGGTGATTLAADSILTGNGTSAIQAESTLSYSSEILDIGADDDGTATIRRLRHTDEAGGELYIRGGDATGTDKAGGDLVLFGGRSTSNAAGGSVIVKTNPASGSSGTTLQSQSSVATFRADGKTLLTGNLIFEGPVVDGNDTEFSITEQTANRTITVPDASGTMALTGVAEHYQYISFLGNSTVQANGDWEFPGGNGISNHTWTIDANESATTVGSTTISVTQSYQHAGIRVPYAGKLVGVFGAGRNANGDRQFAAGLFVGVPDWGTTNAINATLRSYAAANNESGAYTNRASKIEDLTRNFSLSAGDMIYPAIRGDGSTADTIQISMTIVIKTAIPS